MDEVTLLAPPIKQTITTNGENAGVLVRAIDKGVGLFMPASLDAPIPKVQPNDDGNRIPVEKHAGVQALFNGPPCDVMVFDDKLNWKGLRAYRSRLVFIHLDPPLPALLDNYALKKTARSKGPPTQRDIDAYNRGTNTWTREGYRVVRITSARDQQLKDVRIQLKWLCEEAHRTRVKFLVKLVGLPNSGKSRILTDLIYHGPKPVGPSRTTKDAVRARSGGKCEWPECDAVDRIAGCRLEFAHLDPLGPDDPSNFAHACPFHNDDFEIRSNVSLAGAK